LKKNFISIGINEFVKTARKKRKEAKKNGNFGEFLYYQYLENFLKDQREKLKRRHHEI
jgi:hypothetical protein